MKTPLRPRHVAAMIAASLSLYSITAFAEEESRLNGFYVNGFAGMAVLDSTVQFPETPTRPAGKFVDQGGDGPILGARGGWGRLVSRHLYLGAEAEFTVPLNVTSRLMAYGAEYRARLRNEAGVFGRIGWSPERNSLFFLRAGVTIPRQSFQSVRDGNDPGADWSVVPTIGIGAETHITRNVAARVDATYSIPTGVNQIESYRLTAGLVWRF